MIKVGHGALHTPSVLVAIVVHVEIREASQHIFKTAPPPEAIGSTLVIIRSMHEPNHHDLQLFGTLADQHNV
jgi:hypothetical protein